MLKQYGRSFQLVTDIVVHSALKQEPGPSQVYMILFASFVKRTLYKQHEMVFKYIPND